jgi:hypothetical protein
MTMLAYVAAALARKAAHADCAFSISAAGGAGWEPPSRVDPVSSSEETGSTRLRVDRCHVRERARKSPAGAGPSSMADKPKERGRAPDGSRGGACPRTIP